MRPAGTAQRGVALLIVITWIALMVALVGEFTYGTTVDAAQAANARDEVRAHYMALSSVNLSRLLIKIQQRFVDPVMGQAQQMLQSSMGASGATAPTAGQRHSSGAGSALRRPGHQPARHRLRRHADGLLQRLEGRGRRAWAA